MARLGRVKYVPNHDSMARFLLSERVGSVSMRAAGDIADAAAAAERARPKRGPSTGHLAESYGTRPAIGGHEAEGGPRRIGIVLNDARYAAAIELGDVDSTGEHLLERTASQWHVPRAVRKAMGGGKL